MRIITGIAFILNILLWILGIFIGFSIEGYEIGVPIVIGFIAFLVAWSLSGGIVVAPADYFFQPEWSIFKTKVKWSNSTALITSFIAFFIISSL